MVGVTLADEDWNPDTLEDMDKLVATTDKK
jgi:hypothetical protein